MVLWIANYFSFKLKTNLIAYNELQIGIFGGSVIFAETTTGGPINVKNIDAHEKENTQKIIHI